MNNAIFKFVLFTKFIIIIEASISTLFYNVILYYSFIYRYFQQADTMYQPIQFLHIL